MINYTRGVPTTRPDDPDGVMAHAGRYAGGVALMRRKMPYLDADVRVGPVETILPEFGAVDVIFTMAVLVHIHPESEFVFGEMASWCRRFIVTVEDEHSNLARHCARNYQDIFENLGMRQIYFHPSVPGMHAAYCARVFAR